MVLQPLGDWAASPDACPRQRATWRSLRRAASLLLLSGAILGVAGAASGCSQSAAPGTFVSGASMADAREWHTATLLKDGRVLVAGGLVLTGPSLASAELFDPKTDAFARTGSMSLTRDHFAATLLNTGEVLVTGGDAGRNASGARNSAELYDPKSGTFHATGSMSTGRMDQTSTLLQNGHVLVAGGQDGKSLSDSAELYDPKTGTFHPTGQMTAYRRGGASATLLADGGGHLWRS